MSIFEDDIDFNQGALQEAKKILRNFKMPWDLIFLGHCFESESQIFFSGNNSVYRIQKSVHPLCTHSYMVSLKGAKKLLQILPSIYEIDKPVDNYYAQFSEAGRLDSYSFHPVVVTQSDSRSDLGDGYFHMFPVLKDSARKLLVEIN